MTPKTGGIVERNVGSVLSPSTGPLLSHNSTSKLWVRSADRLIKSTTSLCPEREGGQERHLDHGAGFGEQM